MTYNEKILDSMMKYPTIYGSEDCALAHILSVSDVEIDNDGEVSFPADDASEFYSARTIHRTKESILGLASHSAEENVKTLAKFDNRERVCFQPCGRESIPYLAKPYPTSLLGQLIKNPNLKLAEDWKQGISSFLFQIHSFTEKQVRIISTGHAVYSRSGLDYQKNQINSDVSYWKDFVTLTAHLVHNPAVKSKKKKESASLFIVRQEYSNNKETFIVTGHKQISPTIAKQIGSIIGVDNTDTHGVYVRYTGLGDSSIKVCLI